MYSLRAFVLCCSVLGVLSTSDEVLWGDYTGTTITPFAANWTDTEIADLRSRLADARAQLKSLTNDFKYGYNAAILANISDYWANEYNFTARMEYVNKYPQFLVTVQGLRVHVVRVQPANTTNCTVVPLAITHSYPSMCYEFYNMISELTSECFNGIALDVIVIGMPGYAYSDAPNKPGCGAPEIATVIKNVMKVLGYDKFYVQSNDCIQAGSMIATMYPETVLGLYVTTPLVFTPKALVMLLVESLTSSTQFFAETITRLMNGVLSYLHHLITIPDTLSVGLSNNPHGLMAYMTGFASIVNRPSNVDLYDGGLFEQFHTDDVLDIVNAYWFSNSIAGASRTFADSYNWKNYFRGLYMKPTSVPTWVLSPEFYCLPMSAEQLQTKYTNFLGVEVMPGSGHYPAYEKPQETAQSLKNFISKLNNLYTDSDTTTS